MSPMRLSPFFRRPFSALVQSLVLAAGLAFSAGLAAHWFSDCMQCEVHFGAGTSKIGPFDSEDECQKWRQKSLDNNFPYRPCYSDGDDGTAASPAADASLQESTSKALSYGLVHGDAQTFGIGLLGLGAMAMDSAGKQGDANAAAARREAEQRRQQQAREAQASRERFEADKTETLGELKGGDGDGGLKGADEDGLKDVPASKPKKKWKPPHLKAVANPLEKEARPEDFTGGQRFDTWEEAKACGGLAAQGSDGKIACCPQGYPYFCGGQCYTEAAFDDFRVPCASTLRTVPFQR